MKFLKPKVEIKDGELLIDYGAVSISGPYIYYFDENNKNIIKIEKISNKEDYEYIRRKIS